MQDHSLKFSNFSILDKYLDVNDLRLMKYLYMNKLKPFINE